jgi:ribonuclease P protein component
MLAKKYRIPRSLFKNLYSSRNLLNTSVFLVRYLDSKEKHPRFSFSVSKKVEKKAVNRNRFRRIGYNFLKQKITDLKTPLLLNFYYKRTDIDTDIIKRDIEYILQKIKVIQ